jgi:hypothetical protein
MKRTASLISLATCVAFPSTLFAQGLGWDSAASTIGVAAAKSPGSTPWTQPAEYARVRSSDTADYDTLDMAIEWSKQFARRRNDGVEFQKLAIAPYWQNSTSEKKPVNDRGVVLRYEYQPPSACADHSKADCLEWKLGMSVAYSNAKTQDTDQSRSWVDATQTTARLNTLIVHPSFNTGYTYLSATAGVFYDHRDKPTPLVPNGREMGAYLRPELTWVLMGLPSKNKPGAIEFSAVAQYQQGLKAGGARVKANHRWFELKASLGLGSFGDGTGRWFPSIALKRTGGEDATQSDPRRFQSKLALQLRFGPEEK